MSITISATFATVQEAADFLAKHAPTTAVVLTEGDAAADAAGTSRPDNPTVKATTRAKKDTPAPAPAPAPTPAPAPSPAADAVDYPTLQKAVMQLASEGAEHKAAALAIAAEFGAKTFKDMDAKHYAAALAKVNAALAKAKAPANEEAFA